MKAYQLNMTRPAFLKKFLTDSELTSDIEQSDLERVIPDQMKPIYAAYVAIMECNLTPSEIKYVHCDGETVTLKLVKSKLATKIKETQHKEMIRLGTKYYHIKVKIDSKNESMVHVTAELDDSLDMLDFY